MKYKRTGLYLYSCKIKWIIMKFPILKDYESFIKYFIPNNSAYYRKDLSLFSFYNNGLAYADRKGVELIFDDNFIRKSEARKILVVYINKRDGIRTSVLYSLDDLYNHCFTFKKKWLNGDKSDILISASVFPDYTLDNINSGSILEVEKIYHDYKGKHHGFIYFYDLGNGYSKIGYTKKPMSGTKSLYNISTYGCGFIKIWATVNVHKSKNDLPIPDYDYSQRKIDVEKGVLKPKALESDDVFKMQFSEYERYAQKGIHRFENHLLDVSKYFLLHNENYERPRLDVIIDELKKRVTNCEYRLLLDKFIERKDLNCYYSTHLNSILEKIENSDTNSIDGLLRLFENDSGENRRVIYDKDNDSVTIFNYALSNTIPNFSLLLNFTNEELMVVLLFADNELADYSDSWKHILGVSPSLNRGVTLSDYLDMDNDKRPEIIQRLLPLLDDVKTPFNLITDFYGYYFNLEKDTYLLSSVYKVGYINYILWDCKNEVILLAEEDSQIMAEKVCSLLSEYNF